MLHHESVEVYRSAQVPTKHVEALVASRKFNVWFGKASANFDLTSITVLAVSMFGPNVGFAYMSTDAALDGEVVPGLVFLRGDAVSVLPLITCEDTGQVFVALTCQARVPVGQDRFLEIPAGCMDENACFKSQATKELAEELHMSLTVQDLKFLGTYHASPGGCDEAITLFSTCSTMSHDEMNELQQRITGNIVEGERITVRLFPLKDIHKHCTDMKLITALYLHGIAE